MRIFTLVLCFILCVISTFAKDVITKTDGTKIDAKVEEITESVIKYRKASNPTGPVYTIPISSVSTVLYENGDTDTFNPAVNTSVVSSNQPNSPSDDDLINMADSQIYSNQSGNISDTQLLRIYSHNSPSENLLSQAKKFRKIGYIGGGAFLFAGIITGVLLYQNSCYIDIDYDLALITVAGGVLAGGAWCLGFNLKANSLMREARELQSYSATFIEHEIMQFGDNKLTAGISLMGNRMVNTRGLGLSIGFNF